MARAPVSNKVWSGTVSGGALTTVIVTLWAAIPYLHAHVPVSSLPAIAGVLGGIGYFAGGYFAKHQPRIEEVLQAVEQYYTSHPQPPRWSEPGNIVVASGGGGGSGGVGSAGGGGGGGARSSTSNAT